MSKEFKGLDLSEVIFVGRTYDEYVRMFDLSGQDIRNQSILDAPGGACSFTATATKKGAFVTATDIAYYHSVNDLYSKGVEDIRNAVEGLSQVKDQYVWEYFRNLNDLEAHRGQALHDCVEHMKSQPDQYVPCELPALPFKDNSFDMTLSAHFLFTYADRLNYEFHLQTVKELLRVSKREVRIFPLVDLKSRRYEHLASLLDVVHGLGWKSEERKVDYEFQRNANSMLRIYKEIQ